MSGLLLQRLHTGLLSVLLVIFCTLVAQGQDRYVEKLTEGDIYPKEYTFDKALSYELGEEYHKAFWFYINLFPFDPDSAVISSRRIAAIYAEAEPELRSAFQLYFQNDPDNLQSESPGVNMDNEAYKKKMRWVDELTACFDDIFFRSRRPYHLNNSGLARYERGDFSGALKAFDKAIDMDPKAKYYFNRGYVSHLIGRYEPAIQDFSYSMENGHRLSESYYHRGFCLGKLGKKQEAMVDFDQAIALDSNYVEPRLLRGFERFMVGAYDLAFNDLDIAIELAPENPDGYLSRGFCHQRTGHPDQACADWQRARDLGLVKVEGVLNKYCDSN